MKKIVLGFIILTCFMINGQTGPLLEMPLEKAFKILLEKQSFDIPSMTKHKRILKYNPRNLQSLYYLANNYALMGRYDESIIFYEWLKTIPHGRIYFCYNDVGWNYDLKGEYDKAMAEYKGSLRITNFDQTYYNLGYLYARLNINLDKAVEMIKKASRLNPSKRIFHWDALSWAYHQKGEFGESVKWAKKCIEHLPENYKGVWYPSFYFDTNISVYYHLGMSLFELKKGEEAIDAFEKVADKINSADNNNTRRRYTEFFLKWRLPKQEKIKYEQRTIEKDKWYEIFK